MVRKHKDTDLQWTVPKALKIPPDPLQLRVDFHSSAVVVYTYDKETITRKIVSAMDIVHALAKEMTYSTDILPKNTLWWSNTAAGPVFAIFEEAKVRTLAIQYEANKAPKRYTIPVPPCLFICQPGHAPRIFAVKRRPVNITEAVYHAPFPNIFTDGTSCGGNNQYPTDPGKIPNSFWISFFTDHGDLQKRSKKFPKNLIRLWEHLEEQNKAFHAGSNPHGNVYPLEDLVQCGTVEEIMKKQSWR